MSKQTQDKKTEDALRVRERLEAELGDRLLTRREAALLLRVNLSTLDRMISAGRLRVVYVGATGRGVRVPLSSIKAYLAGESAA